MDDKITGSETSIGITDEIAKLKKLLDDGILTQDEYDQQKSRLLKIKVYSRCPKSLKKQGRVA